MTLRSAIITGTASININGTVGATTANTGAFTTVTSTGNGLISNGAGAITNPVGWTNLFQIRSDNSPAFSLVDTRTGSVQQWDLGSNGVNFNLYNATLGSAALIVTAATNVITMPAYGAGAATFSASGVISSVSDETWKTKDGIPTDPDAMLKKLAPGYWYYNDEKKKTFGADRQLGFYAQNVNAAIGPEAAPEPEEGKPWGYYDRSVLAVTVMSLQKALATIEILSERIADLEAK